MSGLLRYGHRGFRKYMNRQTRYAKVSDLVRHLHQHEESVIRIATESVNSAGSPRFEVLVRDGVIFIRAAYSHVAWFLLL